ncbi:glycosyltransferase [bacterium]|nr:glycosyltransferase [bacterium]NDD83519.1 glycosyltransferase [bacterium]NDG31824.1 glycosyltransferase [bacterium]
MPVIKLLVKGWIHVPHSYAMVNCFQLIFLEKYYGHVLDIYIQEMEYFRPHWNNARKLVYKKAYNEILQNIKEYNGEPVDLVYSITYPYNITPISGVKKCVFYTSEFSALDPSYFTINGKGVLSEKQIMEGIRNLYFTSPSAWSARGMQLLNVPKSRNKIITHGVDLDTFKYDSKDTVRDTYGINPGDVLLMNIGAMTRNKGITLILEAMNILVNIRGHKQYKLLLKGTGDLYETKQFLGVYISEFMQTGAISKEKMDNLLDNHVIFTDKTLSYDTINKLYNAADVYVSPYIAEGFNLTTLEAIASGLPVIVPQTGSTKEYIQDIIENGGGDLVRYVNSVVVEADNGFRQNVIKLDDLVRTILENTDHFTFVKKNRESIVNKVRDYLENNYSWKAVADQLYRYFTEIVEL